MTEDPRCGPDEDLLAIRLDFGLLSVSYLSSLLRVVQVALREVARSDDDARPRFDQRPQPVLALCKLESDGDLTLHLAFMEPGQSTPMPELSSLVFGAFLERFTEFVRSLPQPGLWGGGALSAPDGPFESELARRMDQVYRELRRSPRSALSFRGHSIEIEGDRLEVV